MNSGLIKESENQTQRHIQSVKSRMHREINKLEDMHKQSKEDLNKIHQNEIKDMQLDQNRKIIEEIQRKDKIIGELKSNLEVTKNIADKELNEIKERSNQKISALHQKTKHDYDKKLIENEFEMKVLSDKFNDEGRQIHQEGNNKISLINTEMQRTLNRTKEENLQKISNARDEYTKRNNEINKKHHDLMKDLSKKNEEELLKNHKNHQVKIKGMGELHQDETNKVTQLQEQELNEQNKLHLSRYNSRQKVYKEEADNLDNRYNSLVNEMKTSLAKELTKTETKLSDPFYNFTELSPTWRNTVEGIEVKVKIPEYSKQDLHLTTNNKEFILNFNRRYKDKRNSGSGEHNQVSKLESFTTRIDTGVILNPKSIKSSYENGHMTYLISRA